MATFQTQVLLDEIKEIFSLFEKEINYDNSAQNFDVNKYAEDFYAGLLNIVFPTWKLENLNTIIANHPAIDLGGSTIGVQITTETSKSKIEETLTKFGVHKLSEQYSNIYIIMIKGKKIPSAKIINSSGIKFEKNKHIWDNSDILNNIRNSNFTIEQLNTILTFLKLHIKQKPSLYGKILLPIIEQSKKVGIFNSQPVTVLHLDSFNIKDSDIDTLPSEYLEFLKEIEGMTNKVDIVIYTGNLVHEDISIFESAFQTFLLPILQKLNLGKNRLFYCPGISDLDKNKIQEWREKGINSSLNSEQNISEFIIQNKKENDALPKLGNYFNFIKSFYSDFPTQNLISLFDSNFILPHEVGKFNIGVSALNNVWAYSSYFQESTQFFGYQQLLSSLSFIDGTAFKIGAAFFPPDKLSVLEYEKIKKTLQSYQALFFSGSETTKYKTGFYGNTFYSFPTKEDNRFTGQLVEFSNENQAVYVSKTTKQNQSSTFKTSIIKFPTLMDLRMIEKNEEIIERLQQIEFETINKKLIYYGASTCAPANVCDIFVMPKITDIPYENTEDTEDNSIKEIKEPYDIQKIISSQESYVIFGAKETGKSLLLDKIFIDLVQNYDSYRLFPVVINFEDSKNLNILSEIKKYLGINTNELTDKLAKSEILVLIDDITFEEHDTYKLKKINDFKQEYPKIKIIAVSRQSSIIDIPWEYNELLGFCKFQSLFIRSFGTKQIKHLAEKWFKGNNKFNTEEAIDKVIKSFFSFSLPPTPMSASIFFWIIETQEKRQINNSTLIEAFVDKVLENKNQIYRDSFDSKNKKHLLADIAHFMFIKNLENYSIEYGSLIDHIDLYLVDKRFNSGTTKSFYADKLLDSLIEKGIFTKNNNRIKFRFPCFFHFFLALRMQYDSSFKQYVLKEENYLDFVDEIDYYTGLVRNDEDVLEILHNRLHNEYREVKKKISPSAINNFFKVNTSFAKKADLQKVIKNAPSETDIEQIHDEALETLNSNKEIQKKQKNVKRNDRLIMLVSNVLRNTEETSREKGYLKDIIYQEVVSCAVIHMCYHKVFLEQYYNQHNSVPDFLPWKIDIQALLKILPLLHQTIFYSWVGTLKLSGVLLNKINSDKSNKQVSDLEQFITLFCFVDLKASNSKTVLKKYIYNDISFDNNTLIDLCFIKTISYFYLRSKNNSTEEEYYIDLLIELKLKGQSFRKEAKKLEIKKELISLKQKKLNLVD